MASFKLHTPPWPTYAKTWRNFTLREGSKAPNFVCLDFASMSSRGGFAGRGRPR